MRLHNDEPTLLDQLQRLDLVQRVGEDVATCDPPHVFGTHGDWGDLDFYSARSFETLSSSNGSLSVTTSQMISISIPKYS
jgi:hypothetical protein